MQRPLFEAMNISSGALASGESEFEAAGLATAPSRIVDAPRVGGLTGRARMPGGAFHAAP